MMHNTNINVIDWGTLGYKAAWDKQEAILQQQVDIKRNKLGHTINTIYLVEHNHVYTLGKSGHVANVLLSPQALEARGIEFYNTNRGGDITYHGPGQLVGYPIIDLENFKTDIGWYLRTLEQSIINVLAIYNIVAGRSPGQTGVWLDADIKTKARKICAMGVRCSRWVTMHGFALNVQPNLAYFNDIVPCGIPDKQVTSMAHELGYSVSMTVVKQQLTTELISLLGGVGV